MSAEEARDLDLALSLADQADAITTARFGALDLRVDQKPDLTPVTDADEAVESAVRECWPAPRGCDLRREHGGGLCSPDGSGSSTRSTAPRTSCGVPFAGPA